ncbi:MAG: glycoside hydrolase family 3 C-terminal domain-containing protein [Clostridia bacterium]|nr:glycoside hydrolase family 3 C-terminal domain-containing protein [Clostridia bacterium]
MKQTPEQRAAALLQQMTLDEKIRQVTADMLFDVETDYETRRDPLCGSYRNPGHFMHYQRQTPASPKEVAEKINRDVKLSIDAQPHGIPPLENGEALHSAQWGMGTNFPQPISLASMFDPALVQEVADAIGKEVACVGVRQVFAPVVNVVRDCRWGRTVETFGEDVKVNCDCGSAMVRGFEKNGVIATPKHFADNYSYGGRDSNYSETSERTMRETILPPFKACFDAGAQSVMAAYNGWEGVPCSANRRLLTDILRGEWGFSGFVVSDYCGVEGLHSAHKIASSEAKAAAMALKAGLDVILPFNRFETVKQALALGFLTESELDKNVLRVLSAKFRLGLFDAPFADAQKANEIVRNAEHKALALKAAREAIVLLKNDGLLPLEKKNVRRIGLFGESARLIPIGTNYSGPYQAPWQGSDAPTPLQALKEYCGDSVEVAFFESKDMEQKAPQCDVCLYFTTILEGEGSDRSDLRLPSFTVHRAFDDGGLIVDKAAQSVHEDQQQAIVRLCKANANTAVILMNGAPIDMTAWISQTRAVVEAWYPGEQGARALSEILFGKTNPSGKLPITVPKSVGQLPLFYAHKPTGRGYAYCDDDGLPLFPFGFGLSYTTFSLKDASLALSDFGADVSVTLENTGKRDGAEVVQLYLSSCACAVVRPVKELKAYRRVFLRAGESERITMHLTREDFSYYDEAMVFGLHNGEHTLLLGTSSEDIFETLALKATDGRLEPQEEKQCN